MNILEYLKALITENAGPDKWKHFVAGFVICVIGYVFINIWAGIAFAVFAGFAKDVIWDLWLKRGQYDPRDIYWTAYGAIPVAVFAAIVEFVMYTTGGV
jgi:hypothetical protein